LTQEAYSPTLGREALLLLAGWIRKRNESQLIGKSAGMDEDSTRTASASDSHTGANGTKNVSSTRTKRRKR
jgi:hypothetical protein